MASSISRTLALLQALAADPEIEAVQAAPPEIAGRRPTRTHAPSPRSVTLELLAAGQDHQAHLADYLARHGEAIPERSALYEAAAAVAERDETAAADLETLDAADSIRAELTAGRGQEAVGHLACPGCLCWGMLPVRGPAGGWRIACSNRYCGGVVRDTARLWPVGEVVAHHLRIGRAA